MAEITSPLVKSAILASNSAYFPTMVRAAAQRRGLPYTGEMLAHAATVPAIVDAVTVPTEGSVDAWLIAQGGALDQILLDAVSTYDPEGA